MDTHCQTATWSGSGECQNLGAVSSFWSKQFQFHTKKHNIGAETYKLCMFSLYFVKFMIYIVWKALTNNLNNFFISFCIDNI